MPSLGVSARASCVRNTCCHGVRVRGRSASKARSIENSPSPVCARSRRSLHSRAASASASGASRVVASGRRSRAVFAPSARARAERGPSSRGRAAGVFCAAAVFVALASALLLLRLLLLLLLLVGRPGARAGGRRWRGKGFPRPIPAATSRPAAPVPAWSPAACPGSTPPAGNSSQARCESALFTTASAQVLKSARSTSPSTPCSAM